MKKIYFFIILLVGNVAFALKENLDSVDPAVRFGALALGLATLRLDKKAMKTLEEQINEFGNLNQKNENVDQMKAIENSGEFLANFRKGNQKLQVIIQKMQKMEEVQAKEGYLEWFVTRVATGMICYVVPNLLFRLYSAPVKKPFLFVPCPPAA